MLSKAKAKFKGHPKVKSIDQGDVCDMVYEDEMFDACINNQVRSVAFAFSLVS